MAAGAGINGNGVTVPPPAVPSGAEPLPGWAGRVPPAGARRRPRAGSGPGGAGDVRTGLALPAGGEGRAAAAGEAGTAGKGAKGALLGGAARPPPAPPWSAGRRPSRAGSGATGAVLGPGCRYRSPAVGTRARLSAAGRARRGSRGRPGQARPLLGRSWRGRSGLAAVSWAGRAAAGLGLRWGCPGGSEHRPAGTNRGQGWDGAAGRPASAERWLRKHRQLTEKGLRGWAGARELQK